MNCIVFDVDDTLYLERDYVRSGFDAVGASVLESYGKSAFAEIAWEAFERGVRGKIFDEAISSLGLPPSIVPELVAIYRRHAPRIALLQDVEPVVASLIARRVQMAVVTDGPLESQKAKVAALGIERWMNPVVYTAGLGEGFGKPDPRSFSGIQAAFGAAPADCVYIADNPAKDFAGPKALGWRTVRIRREGGLHRAAPSGPDVDVEVDELSELMRAL